MAFRYCFFPAGRSTYLKFRSRALGWCFSAKKPVRSHRTTVATSPGTSDSCPDDSATNGVRSTTYSTTIGGGLDGPSLNPYSTRGRAKRAKMSFSSKRTWARGVCTTWCATMSWVCIEISSFAPIWWRFNASSITSMAIQSTNNMRGQSWSKALRDGIVYWDTSRPNSRKRWRSRLHYRTIIRGSHYDITTIEALPNILIRGLWWVHWPDRSFEKLQDTDAFAWSHRRSTMSSLPFYP